MYFDGYLTKEGGRAGLIFISPLGVRMEYMIRLHFPVSNNIAEYEALLNGLKVTLAIGV
jgi:ribonuclease HI